MTSFNRGDVILVDIVFSGAIGSKRRPAVVISTESFNKSGSKLIVVGITSNISVPFRPGDMLLADWSLAGLLKPSAVRGIIATVDKLDITHKLGKLSSKDMSSVERSIATIIGIHNS
ncbi:PemK-like protein [Crenothrix polyspora]|uniref:PemK-like protein n=1 Tax=Crenothrix polyspora TaxID=360316 RepID=A0A1R4H5Y6_9GAMM|nr:type II toxin-antitoxin system PemK/MazF family toxin [Crenothrix polyspora]SJM91685.1 PemK-like protein [Crenothrix polyspora]